MAHQTELIIEEWLKRAADDELSTAAIIDDESGAPSTACFLSQQMAEKYLKAYLVAKKGEFPKIHFLDKLLDLCSQIDPIFKELTDDAVFLDEYYTGARYPGKMPDFTFKEARQAFETAKRIKKFVLQKIKSDP